MSEVGMLSPACMALIESANRKVLGEPKRNHFASGGFVPYGTYTKWNKGDTMGVAGTRQWIAKNEVGPPEITAYVINDKGNKIWIKFEPFEKTIFPVQESRFYKPKLHRIDFLNSKKKSPSYSLD